MLTILLLACKPDEGLKDNNQSPDQEACECPDNSADVTALQEELNSLRDRVVTLETAPEPETPTSAVVVTEYEVDCNEQTVRLDYYGFSGEAYPLTYTTTGNYDRADHPYKCVVAKIDPGDPPWQIIPTFVEDARLTSLVGADWGPNFGNEWAYRWPGFTVDQAASVVDTARIHEDGWVVHGIPWQPDCTDYTSPDGDCPLRADLATLRVVIIDDKPALRPEAW